MRPRLMLILALTAACLLATLGGAKGGGGSISIDGDEVITAPSTTDSSTGPNKTDTGRRRP